MRIGFVGCVKGKASQPMLAKDLYTSSLFLKRRKYVEKSCDSWWILSAEHGLVGPDEILALYDRALKNATVSERRSWSARVLARIEHEIGMGVDLVAEFHAGKEYRDFGLVAGLSRAGWRIVNPTEGLGIGRQLQFYSQAMTHE